VQYVASVGEIKITRLFFVKESRDEIT